MVYWFILVLIIIFQQIQKKKDIFYLKLALYIFVIGALLEVFTLNVFSEFVMRTSFILFIFGLVLSYRVGGGTINPK